jgi:hypothetical protein
MKTVKISVFAAALMMSAFSSQARIVIYGGGGATVGGGQTRLCPDAANSICATIENSVSIREGDFVSVSYTAENGDDAVLEATVSDIEGRADADGNYRGSQLTFATEE